MFSVIVVSLNAGDKLEKTVNSILAQSFTDYEIVVKDGGSRDGSFEKLKEERKGLQQLLLFQEKDGGIYEAMNQAISHAEGEYVMFLNCGDTFASPEVLKQTAKAIQENPGCGIYYGDTFAEKIGRKDVSSPKITPFACYRNIPCHQSCFYEAGLFAERAYDTSYRIRADYEHFLRCFFKGNVKPFYMGVTVANYEGGGFSESKENRKADRAEHRKITAKYFSKVQLFFYRLAMLLTLAPLRRLLAESKAFSGLYHKLKERLYR